jgi:hypothetical protein
MPPFGKEVHISFTTQSAYQAGIAVRKNEMVGKHSGMILDEHCRDIAGWNQNAATADFAADFQEKAQRCAGRRTVEIPKKSSAAIPREESGTESIRIDAVDWHAQAPETTHNAETNMMMANKYDNRHGLIFRHRKSLYWPNPPARS